MAHVNETTTERRARITRAVMLKIAKRRIEQLQLDDTPEEYVAKCIKKTGGK
jgi:hypothetical protein